MNQTLEYVTIILVLLAGGFTLHKINVKDNNLRKKIKLDQEIQAVKATYTDCSVYATANFLGGAQLLMYQKDNLFLIEEDLDKSMNFLDMVHMEAESQCVQQQQDSLKELGL